MVTVNLTSMDGGGNVADTVGAARPRAFTLYSRGVALDVGAVATINTIVHNLNMHVSGPIPTNHYTVEMIPRGVPVIGVSSIPPSITAKLGATVLIAATAGCLAAHDIIVRATHSASR